MDVGFPELKETIVQEPEKKFWPIEETTDIDFEMVGFADINQKDSLDAAANLRER